MEIENLYYNCQLICNSQNATCNYTDTQNNILLENASDYKFSIIKMTLDSSNLPCFIPSIDNTQSNQNYTSYKVQLKCLLSVGNRQTTIYSDPIPLEYVCNNQFSSDVVPPVLNRQIIEDRYYYIYNITDICDMFNYAMVEARNTLQTKAYQFGVANNITPSVQLISNPPKMVYNEQSNLFSIYYDARCYGGTDATSHGDTGQSELTNILMNSDCFQLFRNFNHQSIRDNNAPLMNFQLNVENNFINNITSNSLLYYIDTQTYPTTDLWSPVLSLVFYSNIGVRPEALGQTFFTSPINNNNENNNIESQIAEISLPLTNPIDYNSHIVYLPSTYRFSDIITNNIQNINIKVNWKSKFSGKTYDIFLSKGSAMTLKILFQKK